MTRYHIDDTEAQLWFSDTQKTRDTKVKRVRAASRGRKIARKKK
jgi:hypothetical protein